LTPVSIGLVFVIFGAVYAITAPIWGLVCDRVREPTIITLCGGVCISLAFLFIGPAPFLNDQP